MKNVPSALTAVSDIIRAYAGAADSQFDMIGNSIYSAAKSIMHAGNKTQFNKLHADAAMYGADHSDATKAIKAALEVTKMTPACKHFRKVYFALGEALRQMGVPAMIENLPKSKDERDAVLDPLATDYAAEFTSIFFATVNMPEKTDAEREAAAEQRAIKKAEKEALALKNKAEEEREARIELDAMVASRVAAATGAPAMTIQEMARAVALALRAGTLDADVESDIIDAVQVRETAALLALASTPAFEVVELTEGEPEYI